MFHSVPTAFITFVMQAVCMELITPGLPRMVYGMLIMSNEVNVLNRSYDQLLSCYSSVFISLKQVNLLYPEYVNNNYTYYILSIRVNKHMDQSSLSHLQ